MRKRIEKLETRFKSPSTPENELTNLTDAELIQLVNETLLPDLPRVERIDQQAIDILQVQIERLEGVLSQHETV